MEQKYIDLLARADEWIAAHRNEYISEVQGLVRFPSVSRADLAQPGAPFGPECRRVLDYAMERGRIYDFEVADHDGCAMSIAMGGMDNAIGMVAHLDVVPVGEGWVYPPFEATYLPERDAMIGRGVSDDKGPAVASLFAMRMLRDLNWPLKHNLRLLCGMSEETGMQDMQRLVDAGMDFPKVSLVPDAGFPVNFAQKGSVDGELTADCTGSLIAFDAGSVRNIIPDLAECVLTEPLDKVQAALAALPADVTEPLTVTACEQGTKIAAAGRAGHAAAPARSTNAIMLLTAALDQSGLLSGSCAKAIHELAELSSDGFGHATGVACADEVSGDLTLVYSVAHLVDGVLHIKLDCRFPVSLRSPELTARMRANWDARGLVVAALSASEPFYIPKDDPRVVALQQLYHEVTGRDEQPYAMGGGTYSRVVPNAISFGPGVPGIVRDLSFLPEGHGGAHGRDEVLFLDNLFTCSKIYAVALALLDEIED